MPVIAQKIFGILQKGNILKQKPKIIPKNIHKKTSDKAPAEQSKTPTVETTDLLEKEIVPDIESIVREIMEENQSFDSKT